MNMIVGIVVLKCKKIKFSHIYGVKSLLGRSLSVFSSMFLSCLNIAKKMYLDWIVSASYILLLFVSPGMGGI